MITGFSAKSGDDGGAAFSVNNSTPGPRNWVGLQVV